MKKILIVGFLGTTILALGACSEYSRRDRAIGGGLIGAGTGALIGGLASRSAGGAVAGGAIGGVAGAIIGAETTPRACRARDYYGRIVRVPCP